MTFTIVHASSAGCVPQPGDPGPVFDLRSNVRLCPTCYPDHEPYHETTAWSGREDWS